MSGGVISRRVTSARVTSGRLTVIEVKGFTLIEVLVALLVLAVGFLGVSGMQAMSLQQAGENRLRARADGLLRDLAARMRMNPAAVAAGDYDYSGKPDGDRALGRGRSLVQPARIARRDLAHWLARVDERLPGARVRIATAAHPRVHTLALYWRRPHDRAQRLRPPEAACQRSDWSRHACLGVKLHVR